MLPAEGQKPEANTGETKQNAVENLAVHEKTTVNINACKVDLSEAHIYKYVIEFSPGDYFSHKEKERLARRFLEHIALDLDTVDIVVGDKFEFFLPHPNAQLSQCYLHVAFWRSNSPKGDRGAVKSFAPGGSQPVYSNFIFSSELCTKVSHSRVNTSVPRIFEGLELCKVSACGPEFNLKGLLASNDKGSKDPILIALTKIFKRSATPMIDWHGKGKVGAAKDLREMGSKVFDFSEMSDEEPFHVGSGFEVRRGISASTQVVGDTIFRVVTPTHAVFFEKGINLAELVVQFVGTATLGEPTYSALRELLKGVTIIKTYGKMGVRQIVDLGKRPGDMTILCGELEYSQKIHDDYANLPCIKVGNSKIDEYLPMSLCTVATGQKTRLPLLVKMKVLNEAGLKSIQCKVDNSARQMRDARSDYGGKFLRESMSSQTLVAFNIKINSPADNQPTIQQIEAQAKILAALEAKSLTRAPREASVSLSSRMSGVSVMAWLFMQKTPSGFQSIVQQLFGAHGVQVKEVRMMSGAPKGDKFKKLADQAAEKSTIVCGIWSKAHKIDGAVKEAYEKTRHFCSKEGMAIISVNDLNASPGQAADIKRVGSALYKLLAKREFLGLPADAANGNPMSGSVLLAVYVTAVSDPQSKKREPNAELGEEGESNAQRQRRKKSLARSFLVTFALLDGRPGSFCRTQTVLQLWKSPHSNDPSKQIDSLTYPGIHELDEASKKKVFSFFDRHIKTRQQVTVLRAGVRPSELASNPDQQLKAEVAFVKEWTARYEITLSYYTVSSSSRATLSNYQHPPLPAGASAKDEPATQPTSDGVLLVEPSFPGVDQWLFQKHTAKGLQPRSLSLTAHLAGSTAGHLFGSDAMVSAASWNFPPSTWSSRELVPVYLARKATRAIVRRFDAIAKGITAGPNDYTAEKLQAIQDGLNYPIYLD